MGKRTACSFDFILLTVLQKGKFKVICLVNNLRKASNLRKAMFCFSSLKKLSSSYNIGNRIPCIDL